MLTMDHFELASALRGVVSDLQKRLRKQTYSADELSLTESHTLSYLYKKGSLFPSELAELNKIRKQSMSQALNRLEELKLIKRVASKEDKRKMAISLTAAAEKIVEKSRHERDVWLAGAVKGGMTEKGGRGAGGGAPVGEGVG